MSMRWKSLVTALAVVVTPALVGVSSGAAHATEERADRHQTSVSIRALHKRVEAGQSSKIRGDLSIARSDAEPGSQVVLEAKPKGATVFSPLGTAIAGAKGGVSLAVTPAVSTAYRWFYAGSDDAKPSRSGIARIKVGPRPGDGSGANRVLTTLSIRATHRPVDARGDSVIRGKLLARRIEIPRRVVKLLARTTGGEFAVVAIQRTDGDGVVRFPVSPTVKTAYRLVFDGTRLLRPSRSGVVSVGVRPAIQASATPTLINPGESTAVSGLVTYEGSPLVGATVDLLARNAKKNAKFSVVGTSTTDATGAVSFTQTQTRTTVYRLAVRHTEGSPPRGVSANVRVVVRAASSLSIRGRNTQDGYAVSGVLRGGGGTIAKQLVSLQSLAGGGSTWTTVASTFTTKRGVARFLVPTSEGTSYRLAYAGGERFAPSVSGVVVN